MIPEQCPDRVYSSVVITNETHCSRTSAVHMQRARLFARPEFLAETSALEAPVHLPRRNTVPIFESADSKLWEFHDWVATPTGQPNFTISLSA